MTNDLSLNSSHDEFSWSEYLGQSGAEAAPWSCFCQNNPPPVNEFKVDQRLETYDPRNTSSICLASIVEMIGPRLRLRLEGTDDRNDFWLMCDSDLLHPFEYSARLGRKLSPPLGFANDLSKWPKSLEKFIQQAAEKELFAPETSFRVPPTRPPRNEFRPGQKLEAVDPKNPYLICPATVKEVNRDQLVITFDGWSLSSQFTISYTSRDLFPCGWCKQSGHDLQPPGNLDKRTTESASNRVNIPTLISSGGGGAASRFTVTAAAKKTSTLRIVLKTSKQYQQQTANQNADTTPSKIPSTAPQLLDKSSADSSFADTLNSTVDKSRTKTPSQLDLSNIKAEAVDQDEQNFQQQRHLPTPPRLEVVKLNETTNLVNNTNKSDQKSVIVYVNPDANLGPTIKASKFHKEFRRFGPGSPQLVYKSLAQGLIDCAFERYRVFYAIPEGQSQHTVKCVTLNGDFRKNIVKLESEEELWQAVRELCQLLTIETSLVFSVKPYKNTPPLISPTPLAIRRFETGGGNQVSSSTIAAANKLTAILGGSVVGETNMNTATGLQTPQSSSSSLASERQTVVETSMTTASKQRLGITVSPHKASHASAQQPPPPPPQLSRTSTSNGGGANGAGGGTKRRLSPNNSNASKHNNSHNNNDNDETTNHEQHEQTNQTISSTTVTPPQLTRASSTNSLSGVNTSRIADWNVEQVASFISRINDSYFSSFANLFRHHEIDGKALLLLNTELIMRYMGFKLGPALKLNNYLEKLKQHSGTNAPLTNDL